MNHAVTTVESSTVSSFQVEPVHQDDKRNQQQAVLEIFDETTTFIENINITVSA